VKKDLKFEDVEICDILQIVKIVKVSPGIDVDPDDLNEEDMILAPGLYGLDSRGELWVKMESISGLFAMLGVNDPYLQAERGKARQREREAKKAKRRKRAA
jgi:hypothetical protein